MSALADATHADRRPRVGVREIAALPLLLVGGVFLPVIGWLFGVALLWSSRCWIRRDKLVGTFLLPGGLLASIIVIGSTARSDCPGSQPQALVPRGNEPLSAAGVVCVEPSALYQSGLIAMSIAGLLIPLGTVLFLWLRLGARRSEQARFEP
jgi:hypothetical protein